MSQSALSIHFFLQLAVILAACRLVGLVAQRVGQPQVVGEMIAGILLGPSLLGQIAPGWQEFLFPKGPAMSILYSASQVGIALYMFLVGLEFDAKLIRDRVPSAVSISLAGLVAPLSLGFLVAVPLARAGERFFPAAVGQWQAMLFLGSAI
jgi:Kef-type K+ transport system membrane component KefB